MQYTNLRLASFALAVGFCLFSAGAASAQATQAVSNASLVESSGHLVRPTRAPKDDDAERAERNPMGWAGIGVKVGVAGVGAGKLSVMGQQGRTDSRTGVHVALPISLGGDGFGWTFEPYFSQSSIAHDLKDGVGNVVGAENVNLQALGMYMGPTFNIHAADPLYVGFGLGLKGAYVLNNGFDYAADVYGRVPVHATYYMSRALALVAEVGFGYGASVFADKPKVMVDDASGNARNVKDDPLYGLAYTWDATIGVRLP